MSRKVKISLVLLISIASFAAVKPYADDYFAIAKNLDIFATLFKEVNTYYVDEIDPETLIRNGIDGMLETLDPYTSYIPEEDLEDYRTITTGQYAGIGSLIGKIDNRILITLPNEGFPADKAGLKIGDEIIEIDGIDIIGKSTQDVSKLLKGQSGTKVTVKVKRFNEPDPISFEIIRDKIVINNISYFGMVSDNVGYIKLSEFTTDASDEVRRAVKSLKSDGAEKLIIDVRNNPGGLLYEAVNICNLFLPKGSEIVSTKGKIKEWNKTYKGLNNPLDLEIPMAVLVNQGSASASEIVAGVIQDYDRGVLIGRKSFGKGLVQVTRPLTYNTQLKVTTAKYYIPSGRCIQSLDYSHRSADGSVEQIPDSLKNEFQTKAGRTVLDGGGITPDYEEEVQYLAPITLKLIETGYLFDYATEYYYTHNEIGEARKFELASSEYDDFVKWLENKDLEYTTNIEKEIEELSEVAKEESYFDAIKNQLSILEDKVSHSKDEDLYTFKSEISELLQEQIAARYYLAKGEVEASIDYDQDIQKAIEILNRDEEYASILAKK